MLITELITIYTDENDYNHVEHRENCIVTKYSFDEIRNLDKKEKIISEIAQSRWDIDEDWKKYEGDLNFGNLWVMPKYFLSEYPCKKVIVGVTGNFWSISETNQKHYKDLITVDYTNSMDRRPINSNPFYLTTILGKRWHELNGLSEHGEKL